MMVHKHATLYLYAERNFYESTTINMDHYVGYASFSAISVLNYAVINRRLKRDSRPSDQEAKAGQN